MLTSSSARAAFEISQETDKTRDRYGRNRWGQQLLLARRLVEAGVEIVTSNLNGPLCGRVGNWDDHAVNHHVFEALKYRAPFFDQAVTALIEDLYARGLDQRVLVVVTGEFGRTPRISYVASSGGGVASGAEGTVQPGRDHWPRANSMLWAGGGIATGGVIGATDRRGEVPEGMRPWFDMPIYHWHAGRLTCIYVRQYIESAQKLFAEARRLTAAQREAMDLIDTLCNDPQVHLAMDFRPGDIQLLHNHQILHSRGDFENWPQPERQRHLLRLWLAPREARPLPEVFAPRYGSVAPGARGGIVVKGTTLKVPLEAE